MADFRVEWVIDIAAADPEAAAREAWRLMRNPGSIANVFEVHDDQGNSHKIDLTELDEGEPDAR